MNNKITQILDEPEIWLPVPEYEGLYDVSNYGNLKRLAGLVARKGKLGPMQFKERLLRVGRTDRGYRKVVLCKDNKARHFRVGRIVATVFVPNPHPDLFNEVNHEDLDKLNDFYKNLSWTSRILNMQHAFKNRNIRKYKNEENYQSKRVGQYDKNLELIKTWPSVNETRRQGWNFSAIAECCRNPKHTHKGFIWKYI